MNKTRLPILIVIASLVLTSLLAFQVVQRSIGARDDSSANTVGFADLNRVASQDSRITGFADLNRIAPQKSGITGFADLNRVAPQKSSITGFADLNRVSPQKSGITGFADLNRVDSHELLPLAGAKVSNSPGRVCPNLSTPYGERDAGVSAPSYVLQAIGCPLPAGR